MDHFSVECRETTTKIFTKANQEEGDYNKEPMRPHGKKSTSANGLKRGKTQLAKSCLIGLESGAKPAMPSRHTLDTHLKTVREKSFLSG